MGQSWSAAEAAARLQGAEDVASYLVAEGVVEAADGLGAAVAVVLESGAVTQAVESCSSQRARSLTEAPKSVASGELDAAADRLAPALMMLDSALHKVRFRNVPSRMSEVAWWRLYLTCLRGVACERLGAICSLRGAEAAAPSGSGSFTPLTNPLLLAVASQADARSLVRLAATCRRLYPLGFADGPWEAAARRAFPGVPPAGDGDANGDVRGRRRYEAIASGALGSVPWWAVDAVHERLAESWRTDTLQYGGWGSAHLQLRTLWREPERLALEAEFEYKYDDGDAVWGGRATERLVVSHERLGEAGWRSRIDARPLHGAWQALPEHNRDDDAGGGATVQTMARGQSDALQQGVEMLAIAV